MPRILLILALAVLATAGALAETGAAPAAPPSAPAVRAATLRADPRLQEAVRRQHFGRELGTYLGFLAGERSVPLGAAEPFAERELVALNVDAPLHEVMLLVARTFHLSWFREGSDPSGYRLQPGVSDLRHRARVEQEARRLGMAELDRRWEAERALAFAPREALEAAAQQGNERARKMLNENHRVLRQLIFSLPPATFTELRARGEVSVALETLPPPLKELAEIVRPRMFVGGPAMMTDPITGERVPIPQLEKFIDHLHLEISGSPERPTVIASLMVNNVQGLVEGRSSNLLYSDGAFGPETGAARRERARPRRPNVPEDHPLLQRVTLEDPAPPPPGRSRARPEDAKTLAELLADLAAQVRVPILAECAFRASEPNWLAEQWWLSEAIENQPLFAALDWLCADFEYEWEFHQGAVLLRPLRWYLDPDQRAYQYGTANIGIPSQPGYSPPGAF